MMSEYKWIVWVGGVDDYYVHYTDAKRDYDDWIDKGVEIFGDLQMKLKNDSIVEMDDCTFTLEYDNKIVLSEVSFDDYEIEDKVDRCSRDLKEWVGATIVEAFTVVEELSEDEDTSIDEQVAQGEEQQAEQ